MARNKYPEETVNLILETAGRLFVEKGYERTSIQDIVDNLGGLSKGAIYHHFKSKEEILSAVTDRMTEESEVLLSRIRDDKDLRPYIQNYAHSTVYDRYSHPVPTKRFYYDSGLLLRYFFRRA